MNLSSLDNTEARPNCKKYNHPQTLRLSNSPTSKFFMANMRCLIRKSATP